MMFKVKPKKLQRPCWKFKIKPKTLNTCGITNKSVCDLFWKALKKRIHKFVSCWTQDACVMCSVLVEFGYIFDQSTLVKISTKTENIREITLGK